MRSVSNGFRSNRYSDHQFSYLSSVGKSLGALASVLLLLAAFTTPAFAGIVEDTVCITEQPSYTQNGIKEIIIDHPGMFMLFPILKELLSLCYKQRTYFLSL